MARKETKDSEREAKANDFIEATISKSIELRSKQVEFYGLHRELRYLRTDMLKEFEKSKDIKHIRDLGKAREIILENFLVGTGLIPRKYGINSISARVVAPTGHYSKELDVVIYNNQEAVLLMKRNNALEYYPRECVFGTIQVKSKLGKLEIKEAFSNIASYKKLYDGIQPFSGYFVGSATPTTTGFGIIFAFDSDLEWMQIISEMKAQSVQYEKTRWPNAIFVLSKGFFLFGNETRGCFTNSDIASNTTDKIHGRPDQDGSTLFDLYTMLMELLQNTTSSHLNINSYYNLPHTTENLHYDFAMGAFAETSECEKHGSFLRKIPEDKLKHLMAYCSGKAPRNWISITHEIYDLPEDKAAEARQPGDVYVYNPEALPLKDVLRSVDNFGITYDMVNTGGLQVWIPWYYSIKEGIIDGCPKCRKVLTKPRQKKPKKTGGTI